LVKVFRRPESTSIESIPTYPIHALPRFAQSFLYGVPMAAASAARWDLVGMGRNGPVERG
jgi:hypothetical protein